MYIPQLNRPNSINFLQLLFHFCEQFGICGVAVMVCGRHGIGSSFSCPAFSRPAISHPAH